MEGKGRGWKEGEGREAERESERGLACLSAVQKKV